MHTCFSERINHPTRSVNNCDVDELGILSSHGTMYVFSDVAVRKDNISILIIFFGFLIEEINSENESNEIKISKGHFIICHSAECSH